MSDYDVILVGGGSPGKHCVGTGRAWPAGRARRGGSVVNLMRSAMESNHAI